MAEAAGQKAPTVYVVDDDDDVRASLTWLIGSVHLSVQAYGSAADFLEDYDDGPGCLLLDVRMPGMTGLELQEELRRRQIRLPVIFITGHGDVPMAVRAVRNGALDFFEKPFPHQRLIETVHQAVHQDADARAERREMERISQRMKGLSPREAEVMDLLVRGQPNKAVAKRLGISVRTVEVHRAAVMHKTRAKSLVDLVDMVTRRRRGDAA